MFYLIWKTLLALLSKDPAYVFWDFSEFPIPTFLPTTTLLVSITELVLGLNLDCFQITLFAFFHCKNEFSYFQKSQKTCMKYFKSSWFSFFYHMNAQLICHWTYSICTCITPSTNATNHERICKRPGLRFVSNLESMLWVVISLYIGPRPFKASMIIHFTSIILLQAISTLGARRRSSLQRRRDS